MSEARSYDETTIQAPTKAIRNLYYKQLSHCHDGSNTEVIKNFHLIIKNNSNNIFFKDMNTMAERDMASTVLLPHMQLYKPANDRVIIFRQLM